MKTKLKILTAALAGFLVGDQLCANLNKKIIHNNSRIHEEKLMENFSEGHRKGYDAALQSSVAMADRLEALGFDVTYNPNK